MRIVQTLAAAALTVGLTAGLAPAALAAGPSTATAHSASAHHSKKPVKAKHAKDQIKLDLHADDSATAGDTVALKGRLTQRTKKGFKPVAAQVVTVTLLDPAGATVLGQATTSAKGTYTLSYVTTAGQVGTSLRLSASFAGSATAKAATSRVVTVTLGASEDGTDDGDDNGTGGTGDDDGTGGGQQ
ncbi:MAG: hypothetical protein JWP61_1999 [Friedmanniella sp.]|nr:hypothetical protein [Friedmanniella sp.]